MLILMNLPLRSAATVLAATWLLACAEREPAKSAEPPGQVSPALVDAAARALVVTPDAGAAPLQEAVWDAVRLEDEAPLCVFSSHVQHGEALFLQEVKKQSLAANARVVFGAFAPGCVHESCDTAPTFYCSVESGPSNTLVVHSRLSFSHKRGTHCSEDCRSVVAGCETEVLKAGKYTVTYGSQSFSLRIPSVLRAPCFKQE